MSKVRKSIKVFLAIAIIVTLLGTSSLLKKNARGIMFTTGAVGSMLILKTAAGGAIIGTVATTGAAYTLQPGALPNLPLPTDNSLVVVASSKKDVFERAEDAHDVSDAIVDTLEDIYDEFHDLIYGEDETPTVKVRRHLGNSSHVVEIPLGSKVWQTDTASEATKSNYEGWYVEIIGEKSCKRIGPISWDIKSVKIVGA